MKTHLTLSEIKTRKKAYLKAIRQAEGVPNLSHHSGVPEWKINYRKNNPEADTDYEDDLLIAEASGISIKEFCPHSKKANAIVEKSGNIAVTRRLSIKTIRLILPNPNYYRADLEGKWHDSPIIVDSSNCLISGYTTYLHYLSIHKSKVNVVVVDTKKLLFGFNRLTEIYPDPQLLDKAFIGLHLESLIVQGQMACFNDNKAQNINENVSQGLKKHSFFKKKSKKQQNFVGAQKTSYQGRISNEKREFLAHCLGLGNRESYRQAKKIALFAGANLMRVVNQGYCAVYEGAQYANQSIKEQDQFIRDYINPKIEKLSKRQSELDSTVQSLRFSMK